MLDQFSDLWGEESLQAVDALGFLLGGRQLSCHLVEAHCQSLQLVAAGDCDAMVELSGAEPLRSILQLPDRARHPVRQPIGERKSDKRTDRNEDQGTP